MPTSPPSEGEPSLSSASGTDAGDAVGARAVFGGSAAVVEVRSGLGLRNGNQSPGGNVTPQTFPGTSNSTAMWKNPCRASGG